MNFSSGWNLIEPFIHATKLKMICQMGVETVESKLIEIRKVLKKSHTERDTVIYWRRLKSIFLKRFWESFLSFSPKLRKQTSYNDKFPTLWKWKIFIFNHIWLYSWKGVNWKSRKLKSRHNHKAYLDWISILGFVDFRLNRYQKWEGNGKIMKRLKKGAR